MTTVVYRTIVWPYLPDDVRATAESAINAAGARATADAPLALIAFEGAADDPGRTERASLCGRAVTGGCSPFQPTSDHCTWLDTAHEAPGI